MYLLLQTNIDIVAHAQWSPRPWNKSEVITIMYTTTEIANEKFSSLEIINEILYLHPHCNELSTRGFSNTAVFIFVIF